MLLGGSSIEEPVTETKLELEGVNAEKLEEREGLAYVKGSDAPYTGKVYGLYENGQKQFEANCKDGNMYGLELAWYENGQKQFEANFKDGKTNGLLALWHDNGQKSHEANFKDGKRISEKWWDSKGEPVDTYEEALK